MIENSINPVETKNRVVDSLLKTLISLDEFIVRDLLEKVVGELYLQGLIQNLTEDIILETIDNLNNLDKFNITKDDFLNYIDELYKNNIQAETIESAETILIDNCKDNTRAVMYYYGLKDSIEPYIKLNKYEYQITKRQFLILNEKNRTVDIESRYSNSVDTETIINAFPVDIIMHDNPLCEDNITYSISWISKLKSGKFITADMSAPNIETDLNNSGFVLNPKKLSGIVSKIILIAKENNFLETKAEIETKGIYYDKSEGLKLVKYQPVDSYSLKDALKVLDELVKCSDDSVKLMTVIKWGLLAPFNFSRKSASGEWMPWLYLTGKASSGKTTMAKIVLFLYGGSTPDNEIGGSSFDTVARLGNRISQSTFPIVVNEPEAVFNKKSTQDMIKSAIESTTARSKYSNNKFTKILSLNPVIFTSNHNLPNDDALTRRFIVLGFNYSERKSIEQIEEFEDKFRINNNLNSPLLALQALFKFFLDEIKSNPDYLDGDWKNTADEILRLAYYESEVEMPNYTMNWAKPRSLDDLDSDVFLKTISFFKDKFNQAFGPIKMSSFNNNNLDSFNPVDFKTRVEHIIDNQLISSMWFRTPRGSSNRYVCIGRPFIDELQNQVPDVSRLESLSEVLGGEYTQVKRNNKTIKVCQIELNKFISTLYGTSDE